MGEADSSYRQRLRSLKSGRIARVALAYAAAGWLLVQVASTMLVPLGLPAWALRVIIVLVIAGFFIAVAVAWGFGTRESIALRPDEPKTHSNAACTAMLSGDHDAVLDLLERAITLGWSNARWLVNDNDLVPLHDHPRFKQILARLS